MPYSRLSSAMSRVGHGTPRGHVMKTLLVASEGGHLSELHILAKRMCMNSERTWVTFDSPQSRSLLAGEEVHYAPFAGTRDLVGTARAAIWARNFLRNRRFDVAVSTGASIAVAILPIAARAGTKCYYIESATRTNGPSLTGRLLMPLPAINLYTQYERWGNWRWKYNISIFDGFQSVAETDSRQPNRIVVSFGLNKGFGFRRLAERLVRIIPEGTDVLWQVGHTDVSGLNIYAHISLPADELKSAMVDSDVVIAHAGVGTIVSALQAGKRPIAIPRKKEFNEHIDNHQELLVAELGQRGLIFGADANELQWADVTRASAWRVEQDVNRFSTFSVTL
jgi:UDP-N-acetylglucosamine--N-acetylmuramyl-(pentapeptide) pyrophosphoryl-undecaprenol N-acetylglucosamine transferase